MSRQFMPLYLFQSTRAESQRIRAGRDGGFQESLRLYLVAATEKTDGGKCTEHER